MTWLWILLGIVIGVVATLTIVAGVIVRLILSIWNR